MEDPRPDSTPDPAKPPSEPREAPGATLRPMADGEEEAVCALVSRVFDAFVAPGFSATGIAEFYRYAEARALAARRRADHTVLVAETNGVLAGMIEIRGADHIGMLFVEERGRGLGRLLVSRAVERWRAAGCPHGKLTVHASRYAAPIYRKFGFETEGPERTEHGITYVPMAFRESPRRSRSP